ncbi:MAG: PD40 domain-containing protein, partial [Chitinophagaceae bacterium]|nr:PD40 domain-containing protein [Chitinophagaceae bacterium]
LAEIYYVKRDFDLTLFYADKAIISNEVDSFSPLCALADRMKRNKDWTTEKILRDKLKPIVIENKKIKERNAQTQAKLFTDDTPILGANLQNMGDSINTTENEYLPSLSLDGHTLVFTRNVGGNEDFFISKKDSNSVWHKAQNMGYPPNTNMPDGGAKLSVDGNYLFYTRCDLRSPDGIRNGGCDLVFSYRQKDKWSEPQYFGYTINTTAYEGQPCLNADNNTLYFVSNREGGYGGYDIWMSTFENKKWTKPVNLGPNINTAKDETSPFIHPDNETLYFASNGLPGLGQTDLFISRKDKNGVWGKPLNLGAPINSERFEGSIIVSAKGKKGYLASDRDDSKGGLDIYSFDTYSAIQPNPTICLKGFVRDKYYDIPVLAQEIVFSNLFDQTVISTEKSNEGDGSYTKALKMGKTYIISCHSDLYRPFYKKIALLNDSIPEIFNVQIKLKQPGLIDTLFQAQLSFDSISHRLDSISYKKIDTVMKRWKDYTEDSASVVVFLKCYYYSGENDDDPMYKYNLDKCLAYLQEVNSYFEKRKIACWLIMQDPCMTIYNDDESLFDKVELNIVEYY